MSKFLTPAEIVAELSYTELVQIHHNYTIFERDGIIDQCFLRDTATIYLNQFRKNIDMVQAGPGIVSAMEDIAFETYRRLAKQYMNVAFMFDSVRDEDV